MSLKASSGFLELHALPFLSSTWASFGSSLGYRIAGDTARRQKACLAYASSKVSTHTAQQQLEEQVRMENKKGRCREREQGKRGRGGGGERSIQKRTMELFRVLRRDRLR